MSSTFTDRIKSNITRPAVILGLVLLGLFGQPAAKLPAAGDGLYLGLNTPGLAVGYQKGRVAGELRGFKEDDVDVYGARLRYSAAQITEKKDYIYTGVDAFHTSFEGEITEGEGTVAGLFAGLQVPLISGLTLNVDVGPYQINVEDDLSGLEKEGLSYVLNLGLNVHFRTDPGVPER